MVFLYVMKHNICTPESNSNKYYNHGNALISTLSGFYFALLGTFWVQIFILSTVS